ncbi:hypothetical protein PENSPDRAFT_655102 [Peniophora sp. CONT]|nr:hypothetical protein PENSPDRAFT_655102 [Peniophora sp. CONT]
MELYSTHSDVSKTELVNNTGAIVYRITTELHLSKSKTTVTRFESEDDKSDGQQPVVIAEIVWHHFDDDEITFRGQQREAQSFCPNHGMMADRREFTGTSGRAYYWTESTLHTTDGVEAARWHNRSHGIFNGHPHKAYLFIADVEIVNDLDEIILVMVYHFTKMSEEVENVAVVLPAGVEPSKTD